MNLTEGLIRSLESVITKGHLLLIFGAVSIFFMLVSIALVYHWRNFTTNGSQIKKAMTLYFIVSGTLFLGLIISLFSYIP